MRVVRCHQFAAFEETTPPTTATKSSSSTAAAKPTQKQQQQQHHHQQKQKPRLLKEPLPLRDVLKLHYDDDMDIQQVLLKPHEVLIETYYVGNPLVTGKLLVFSFKM